MVKPIEKVWLIIIKSFWAYGISVGIVGTHDGERSTASVQVEWLLMHMKPSPRRLPNFCPEFQRLMMKSPLQI